MSIQGSPLAEATSNTTHRKIVIVPPAGAELFTAPCCIPSGLTASSRHASPSEPPSMPIEMRKRKLAQLVRHVGSGLHLSEHLHGHGIEIFEHACKLGCEGIVSKRVGSRYVSGRTDNWIKVKNPTAPAVRREAEEDWGKVRWR
jgi:ATP dependent DNA ligase domain